MPGSGSGRIPSPPRRVDAVYVSGHTILCVDDDPHVRQLISRVLHFAGYRCDCAADVHEARRLLAMYPYSVVLCDIGLPGESGLELLTDIARRPSVAAVMVTGEDNPRSADTALELGAYGYVTKPFATNDLLITIAGAIRRNKVEEARSAALDRAYAAIAASEADLRRAYAETVARLGRAMEFHDVETGAHVERVGASAYAIAVELGLPEVAAERVRLVSPLHDIGKIAISETILRKPGALTDAERRQMERHTEVGHELLAGSGNDLLELAATVAWTHHERWDGTRLSPPARRRGDSARGPHRRRRRRLRRADERPLLSRGMVSRRRPRLSPAGAGRRVRPSRRRRVCTHARAEPACGGGMSAHLDRSLVTCVVADDHPPIVDAVVRYLVAAGFPVLASAEDGDKALAAIEQHHPAVCVSDIRMPHLAGLELARRAKVSAPETAVLLYSGFADRGLVAEALDAGARGFALKDGPLTDLVRAIDLVASGDIYVDPVLAADLARSAPIAARRLTGRERDVLRLLAEGGSYGEIGSTLFLSADTVRAHAQHAMTKLGAKTRTQAVALALRDALIV